MCQRTMNRNEPDHTYHDVVLLSCFITPCAGLGSARAKKAGHSEMELLDGQGFRHLWFI